MKTICKFRVNEYSWTRDHWSSKTCYEDIQDIFNEVKAYIGLSSEFNYNDFYGDSTSCKVTITNIELEKRALNTYDIIITEEANIKMPEHYIPCPWQIIKPNMMHEPENWSDLTSEERKAFRSKFTFLSPNSVERL